MDPITSMFAKMKLGRTKSPKPESISSVTSDAKPGAILKMNPDDGNSNDIPPNTPNTVEKFALPNQEPTSPTSGHPENISVIEGPHPQHISAAAQQGQRSIWTPPRSNEPLSKRNLFYHTHGNPLRMSPIPQYIMINSKTYGEKLPGQELNFKYKFRYRCCECKVSHTTLVDGYYVRIDDDSRRQRVPKYYGTLCETSGHRACLMCCLLEVYCMGMNEDSKKQEDDEEQEKERENAQETMEKKEKDDFIF